MAAARQQEVGDQAGDRQEASGELGNAAALSAAVASLQHLDASALLRRWRALVGGAPPQGLGRPLTLRMLAYKLQAERLGDLDRSSRRELEAALNSHGRRTSDRASVSDGAPFTKVPAAADAKASPPRDRIVRPGTMLMREHGGMLHRVTVLGEGFSWNGRTYDSLSQVAFAITGTRWNGPRFFGLRDKPIVLASVGRSRAMPAGKQRAGGDGQPQSTEKVGP